MGEEMRWIAAAVADDLNDAELRAEYRAMRLDLLQMMEDWKRLRDAERGCPAMKYLLDG